jgi:diguanylate cyclase (GGDEF)-like protein
LESRQYASKFKVSSLTKELQFEANLRLELQRLGFQTTAYSAKALDAHILIIDTVALEDSLSQVVERALAQNPDLRLVLICKQNQMRVLLDYKKYQADSLVDADDPLIKEKTIWAIERSARLLYLFYQNEQLLKDYSDVQRQLEKSLHLASTLPIPSNFIESKRDAQGADRKEEFHDLQSPTSLVRNLFRCEDMDSTLRFFMENAPQEKKVLLIYDSKLSAFRVVCSEGLGLDDHSSLRYSTNPGEMRRLVESRFMQLPDGLEDLLVRIFHDPHFIIFPMVFNNQVFGFFAMSNAREELSFKTERDYLEVMGRVVLGQIELFWARSELRNLEIRDGTTSLYNEKFYLARLDSEMAQAAKSQQPLSLLVFEIDNFEGLKTLLGEALFTHKFFLWCNHLSEFLGAQERAFRLGEKTFAFILPHSYPKQAVSLAERLMKTLSVHSEFKDSFQTVLSFGVSSFPQLCTSSSELDATARRVLKKVQKRGGNRVGVFRPSAMNSAPPFRAEAD